MGFHVPSLTHIIKSHEHGGKHPPFEPQETIKIWFLSLELYLYQFIENIIGACVECLVSLTSLNTSPKPNLKRCCHTQNLRPMWSGKSQLPCSQPLELHRLTSSELRLRTRDPVWTNPYYTIYYRYCGLPMPNIGIGVQMQKLNL